MENVFMEFKINYFQGGFERNPDHKGTIFQGAGIMTESPAAGSW
jgi:hypothetical protein